MKQCIKCQTPTEGSEVVCEKCGSGTFIQIKAEREPPESIAPIEYQPKLFLSHAWDYSEGYDLAVRILNSTFKWENLSIPIARAIKVAGDPQSQAKQLKKQIADRIEKLDAEISDLSRQLDELDTEWEQLKDNSLVIRILQDPLEYNYLSPEKRRMLLHQQASIHLGLTEMEDRLSELSDGIHNLTQRLNLASIERNGLAYRINHTRIDIFKPRANKEARSVLIREQALSEAPILALAIYAEIIRADCLIIISTPNSTFKHWMGFEIEVAGYASKPILAAAYPHGDGIPADFKRYGVIEVPLQGVTLKKAIIDILKSPKE